MSKNNRKVYLVDGSGYIFRAYYAIAPLRTKEGFPTNALYGYVRMLLKLLSSADSNLVVVVFDSGRETFRTEMFKEYKANRKECPDDLAKQIPYFRTFSEALGLRIMQQPGFEADDIIGTVTEVLSRSGIETVIVTGDKDLMQLVRNGVTIWDTMRDIRYDDQGVVEKMGVEPSQIVELLAIMGDSSDNVPGLTGAGPKTAVQLIKKYGTVENIINSVKQIESDTDIRNRKKISAQIESDHDILRLSKKLVQIDTSVPLKLELAGNDSKSDSDDGSALKDIQLMDADELYSALVRKAPNEKELRALVDQFEFASLVRDFRIEIPEHSDNPEAYDYRVIYRGDFGRWLSELDRQKLVAFDLETSSLNPLEAEIIGASFCWDDNTAYYVPLAHKSSEKKQLDRETFIEAVRPIFANRKCKKIGQNLKYDLAVLANYKVQVKGVQFDTMLAAYLLNPDRRSYNLSAISQDILGRRLIEYDELLAGKQNYCEVEIDYASQYACQDAHVAWLLSHRLKERLEAEKLTEVFDKIEVPLLSVLQRMERHGVKLDVELLRRLADEFRSELEALQKQIYALAGTEFNLNSPKQLADVLFNKLGISAKGLKKTKTGISTDSSVLEKLVNAHPVPSLLLRYRTLHKLLATYIEALPAQISPITGRLHAKFNQAVTATGRLSSSDPNLQNIPIQTEEGQRIRGAFIAEEGSQLIAADYSQIELRILAHLSEDENLIDAFRNEIDIHSKTAREVLGLDSAAEITPAMRRMGKMINFGVIYGMSGFRLARELEIPVSTASQYIENYFARYPAVQQYFDSLEKAAIDEGFVSTLFGRKRLIRDIDTSGRDKGFALRAAVNAPIQGTAADIIKLAMIAIDREIEEKNLPLKMTMQIHDELVFECPSDSAETAQKLIIRTMEEVVDLKAPLKVELRKGASWQEAHS